MRGAEGRKLALQPAHSVLATASNAVVQSPANFNPADTGITDGSTGNVTFTVPPNGIVLVTIRANVDEATMQSSILSKVALFIDHLPEGVWQISYEMRAESPGAFHALPVLGHAMYVPEIRTNGAEVRIRVLE